jgi:hypothetical protein
MGYMAGGMEETLCEGVTMGARAVIGGWQEPGHELVSAGEDGHLGSGHPWPFFHRRVQIV